MNKTVLTSFTILCLLSTVFLIALTFNVQPAKASGTIYIRADGTVEGTDKIQRDGAVYTFTDNIYDEIVVDRSNITIDGNGYTLQGSGGWTEGFYLHDVSNVTIRKTKVKGFFYGIQLNSSNCNNISGNNLTNNYHSIWLHSSSNFNSISENNITNSNYWGIYLGSSSNNVIYGNDVTNGGGIWLGPSNSNTVSGNILTNGSGIQLFSESSHNRIVGNNITNSTIGIELSGSNNTVSGNTMIGNERNFDVSGDYPSHSIDDSNLVNGKPVYYLVNQKDLVINPGTYPEIGYLALVNCTDIVVESLTLTNMRIPVVNTKHSKIANNNMTNVYVRILESSNNTLYGNSIANSFHGVYVGGSDKTTISRNNLLNNNGDAIVLDFSSNNIVSENNIVNNSRGIVLWNYAENTKIYGNNLINNTHSGLNVGSCSGQTVVYHNNFINNTNHVIRFHGSLVWDNGYPSGGNYWSNYTGVDPDHDGIGDSAHVIDENNIDRYPLMGMFSSYNTTLGKHVNVISNSTIEDFEYFESNSTIRMYVSGEEGHGFCRVSIPHALMNVTNISVIIDDGLTPVLYDNYTLFDNGTHRWIYFAYPHSLHKIDIIPEYPSFLILPLFMIATLLTVMVHRRKQQT